MKRNILFFLILLLVVLYILLACLLDLKSSKQANLKMTSKQTSQFLKSTKQANLKMTCKQPSQFLSKNDNRKQCIDQILATRLCAAEIGTLLELLDDVVATLESLQTTFFMSGGTLLGSWRHHGMIPWDDDIDLYFKGKNYCTHSLSNLLK